MCLSGRFKVFHSPRLCLQRAQKRLQTAFHLPVISRGFFLTARDFIFNCLTQYSSDDWDHLAADRAASAGEAGMAKGRGMAGKGGGILRVVPRRLCLLPMWNRVKGSHPLECVCRSSWELQENGCLLPLRDVIALWLVCCEEGAGSEDSVFSAVLQIELLSRWMLPVSGSLSP